MNFCLPLKTFVYSFDYKNKIQQFEERPGCDKQYVTHSIFTVTMSNFEKTSLCKVINTFFYHLDN